MSSPFAIMECMKGNFLRRFLATRSDYGLMVARVTLGGVMFPHGAQKLFGWFGGNGFQGTMQGMSQGLGIPQPLVFLAIMAESIGALMLIFGLGGRLAAFGVGVTMVVAGMMHVKNGFFMNWFGQQAGEGYEYHLLTIGLAIVTMIAGSGALSVDRLLARTESE